jgi:hypothetical protein
MAEVFAAHAAAAGDQIAFRNHIFDDHLDIGKGFAELRVKG